MNYFELFNIPVQLKVDKAGLHQKYIALSRQYHPDYFANAGPDKLSEVLEVSASVNKAYKIFQEPDATIKYTLELKGLLEEEEKYELPADFLMEVMEINEQVMDLDLEEIENRKAKIENMQSALASLHTNIYLPVAKTIENYKDGITSSEELMQVKQYYYKKKYLDRIRRELAGKL